MPNEIDEKETKETREVAKQTGNNRTLMFLFNMSSSVCSTLMEKGFTYLYI
jgi:hypothetical protein